MTTTILNKPFLKMALLGDAIASAATGLLLAAGAPFLTDLLGIDAALLLTSALILLPFAAFVAFNGTRNPISRPAVWAIIVINLVWVAGSFVLLTDGIVQPTLLGTVFVAAQAIVVLGFAIAEYAGLKR